MDVKVQRVFEPRGMPNAGEPYFIVRFSGVDRSLVEARLNTAFPGVTLKSNDISVEVFRHRYTVMTEHGRPWAVLSPADIEEAVTEKRPRVIWVEQSLDSRRVLILHTNWELSEDDKGKLLRFQGVRTEIGGSDQEFQEWVYGVGVPLGNTLPKPEQITATLQAQLAPDPSPTA